MPKPSGLRHLWEPQGLAGTRKVERCRRCGVTCADRAAARAVFEYPDGRRVEVYKRHGVPACAGKLGVQTAPGFGGEKLSVQNAPSFGEEKLSVQTAPSFGGEKLSVQSAPRFGGKP